MRVATHAIPPTVAPPKAPTIASLARDSLDDCEGNVERAAQELTAKLMADAILLRLVIENAVAMAAMSATQAALRHERAALLRPMANPPSLGGVTLMTVLSGNLLDFPLAGGLRLGDATKTDVEAQVHRYEAQASDMAHKGRWLAAVADLTPPKKTVGAVLSAERLEKLFLEAH